MKSSKYIVLFAAVIFSVSFALGQSKTDCPMKSAAATKSGCCTKATKTSRASDNKQLKECPMHAKQASNQSMDCPMHAKNVSNHQCTEAEKAQCEKMKATMMKTSNKSGCCKGKIKDAEAQKARPKSGNDRVEEALKDQ